MSGCRSHRSWVIVLAAAAASIPPPALALMCQGRASYSSDPGHPPVQVAFQALVAAGLQPYGFHWDFGDGSSSNERNPSHSYEQGSYGAILTVTDSEMPEQVCRDTIPILLGIVVDPICGATTNTRWGVAPLSVGFMAYPALVGDPEPYTWTWRFGDGETSSAQSPTHSYFQGTYYAVATLHTPIRSYDCYPTLRISATPSEVADVTPSVGGRDLRLDPAHPNPFGVLTAIGFELPHPGRVRLSILDLSGRVVARLVDGYRPSGRHAAIWQGGSDLGGRAPAGLYFAQLVQNGVQRTTRIVRLR